jgi:ribosomal protein S18 acetylase RimI-like enzyme
VVLIRRAIPVDLGALVELNAEYCLADAHTFDESCARDGFTPLLDSDALGLVRVVELDGRLEGYAVVTWGWSIEAGGREALLDEIYVRTRGRGIGRELVGHLVDDCRAAGAKRVILETEQSNDRARRFYERAGFVVDDSVWLSLRL